MVLAPAADIRSQEEAVEDGVKVTSFEGDVKIIPAGKNEQISPKKGMILRSGDAVTTGKDSYLEMAFDENDLNTVQVEADSHVVIRLDNESNVELISGKAFTVLSNLEKDEEFRIKTPAAVCGARGTGWETSTDGWVTTVSVFDNKVFLWGVEKDGRPMKKKYWVRKGYERYINKFEKPAKLRKIQRKRYDFLLSRYKKIRDARRAKIKQLKRLQAARRRAGDMHQRTLLEKAGDKPPPRRTQPPPRK